MLSPPPPELSEEGAAKKPWRKPQIRSVRFGRTLGPPRASATDSFHGEDDTPFPGGFYDPNLS